MSPRGRIVYVSDYVVGGSVHDSVHWQVSDVVKRFKEPYPTAFTATGKRRAVFGDKAYPCINTPDDWQLIITKTAKLTYQSLKLTMPRTRKWLQWSRSFRKDTLYEMPLELKFRVLALTQRLLCQAVLLSVRFGVLSQRLLLFCVFWTNFIIDHPNISV